MSELLISRSFDEPEGHVVRALLPARWCGLIAKAVGTSERSATCANSCSSIGGEECPPHKMNKGLYHSIDGAAAARRGAWSGLGVSSADRGAMGISLPSRYNHSVFRGRGRGGVA
jgi:hypothetical protein